MPQFSQIDWGDVPTWLGAIGAVGAFVVYYLLLRGELSKRHGEAELRRTFTPQRIAAWTDGSKLIIQNAGDEPVFNLVVYVGAMGTDFNDPEQQGDFIELVVGTVGPSARLEDDFKMLPSRGQFPDIPEVAIEFTDCSDVHWRREPRKQLKQIKSRRPFD